MWSWQPKPWQVMLILFVCYAIAGSLEYPTVAG